MKSEEDFKKDFGKNLSRARKLNGYTQLRLAEELNYSDKAVSKWERGESVPDAYTIIRIAELFKISPSTLFGNEDSSLPENTVKLRKKTHPVALFVPIISSISVVFIASVLFMVFKMIPTTKEFAPYIFLIALPAIFIELVVFSFIWWRRPHQFICLSCLIWSVGATAYTLVQLFANLYEFRFIFIPCAILQVICIIVFLFIYFISKNKKRIG